MEYLLAAIFLPLFPFSVLVNVLLASIRNPWLRILLMMVWPVTGVNLILLLGATPPQWILYWAAATAVLYAFRSLDLRDLNQWSSFIATSAWSLLWLLFLPSAGLTMTWPLVIGLALPLVFLPWLSSIIGGKFGGAYAGLVNGLAINLPRLTILLVLLVLAITATPLFPGFFVLLGMINRLLPAVPLIAVAVLLVWLFWTWSGMRILQGFIVGKQKQTEVIDISRPLLAAAILPMIIFVIAGLVLSGEML
jgi:hypothetical protein